MTKLELLDQTGLGRLASKDERDHGHLMPRLAAAKVYTERYWWTPPAFDQGATSMCVAYAGVRYLMSGPVLNKPIPFEELYKQCQDLDEWDGDNYDGTSTRGLMKSLQARGLVGEYTWAFEAGPIIDHVLTAGPVVVGTTWTDEMSNPTLKGYITISDLNDESAGGHEWCIVGANRKKRNPDRTVGAVRAVNSWGKGWGTQSGKFWVTFRDLDILIKHDGEACVATEIKGQRER